MRIFSAGVVLAAILGISSVAMEKAVAGVWADNGPATTSPTNATYMRVRQSGEGHQLIIPYFNTQAGNVTLLNLVNTDNTNGKAVKVRFRGASNSDDILDFQVYLSPQDVWAASVVEGPSGVSRIATIDTSCTLPAGVGSSQGTDFVTTRLPPSLAGDLLANETREGYIEILNMADIPPFTPNADGSTSNTPNPLFTAIKHVDGVAPCTPSTMATLADDTVSLSDAYARGFRAPSATLYANWTIFNVLKAGATTGEATALTGVISSTLAIPARGNIVFFPQTDKPAPTIDRFTADPSLRTTSGAAIGDVQNGLGGAYTGGPTPIVNAAMFDLPDLSTPYITSSGMSGTFPPTYVDPVFYTLNIQMAIATLAIRNEFLTDPSIGAATDWVFSQPTRRYSVAADYRPLLANPSGQIGRAFMANNFYSAASTEVSGFQICANTGGLTYWNREERNGTEPSFQVSPGIPTARFRLCGETSVLAFNSNDISSLGSEVARTNVNTGDIRDGWAQVLTGGAFGLGIPIIGKSFSSATAGSLNLGLSWEHRYVPTFP